MKKFFSCACRLWRCLLLAIAIVFVTPYVTALVVPCSRTADDKAWLARVIVRVEQLRDDCEDPELREVLTYTARRYRRLGAFDVSIRECGEGVAGLNSPQCPGVLIDPSVVDQPLDWGVIVLVHEARHDYFPFYGHSHYKGLIPSVADTERTKLEKLMWPHLTRP
jgi:hypothetical protein